MQLQDRVEFLKDEINKSNYKYYIEEDPYLSDVEYDKLFAELKQLEEEHPELKTPDSPTQRVGSVSEKFFPHTHKYRLYSLDNTYNAEELTIWYEKICKEYERELELVCDSRHDAVLDAGERFRDVLQNSPVHDAKIPGTVQCGWIGGD